MRKFPPKMEREKKMKRLATTLLLASLLLLPFAVVMPPQVEASSEQPDYSWMQKVDKDLLKKLWNDKMTMKQVAELAYFIIKYIQKEELDNSVGVNENPPNDKPQVWFIPHNPHNAKELSLIHI